MTKDKVLNLINLIGLPEPHVYNHEDEVIFEWSKKTEIGQQSGTIVRLFLENNELELMVSFDNAPAIFADIRLETIKA
jgi:hypothetical protein